MALLLPDLSLNLSQRRWACVIDPTLALSEYGLPLVKQLGDVMDLWVVREFWHILDNTYFYCQQQDLTGKSRTAVGATPLKPQFSPQAIRALQEWDRLRVETDLGSLNLFWIGDGIGESFLPKEKDASIVGRWEVLARSLENQQNERPDTSDPLNSAFRDAVALAAALGSAFILTHRSPEEWGQNLPPGICLALASWGVNYTEVERDDAIASLEGEQLRQLLVHAGVSKLLWAGLHLAVLHLVVPAAPAASPPADWSEEFSLSELEAWQDVQEEGNLWEGARAFWYSL